MSISERFHSLFYHKLIQGLENPINKAILQKGSNDTDRTIPVCAFEYFKSEELLPLADVSSHCYFASMMILRRRIKPLTGLFLKDGETRMLDLLTKPFLALSTHVKRHPEHDVRYTDIIKRFTMFAKSAPIRGLTNPPLAAIVYEITFSSSPDTFKGTYRDSLRFIGESDCKLFEIYDEAAAIYDPKLKILYPPQQVQPDEDQLKIEEVD